TINKSVNDYFSDTYRNLFSSLMSGPLNPVFRQVIANTIDSLQIKISNYSLKVQQSSYKYNLLYVIARQSKLVKSPVTLFKNSI
ncbi:hypothetical protein, partial [Granulicatella sp. 19428wC4_WM01]|uniref:hypothetical protein n=1 Tax=Granulicatella sp. 19428wC4_WM01 TaxID=2782471 RepID=UPI001D16189D